MKHYCMYLYDVGLKFVLYLFNILQQLWHSSIFVVFLSLSPSIQNIVFALVGYAVIKAIEGNKTRKQSFFCNFCYCRFCCCCYPPSTTSIKFYLLAYSKLLIRLCFQWLRGRYRSFVKEYASDVFSNNTKNNKQGEQNVTTLD